MISIEHLKKGSKKGISPVIATIILIAVALVLALVVGVFAFGLFSSNANTVSLKSATLTGAGAFQFAVSNPSGSAVTITALSVNGASCTGPTYPISIAADSVYSLATPCTATGVTAGNNYNFDFTLSNGQAITGVAVAT
jgi:archaeal type IV pilus assembly protein PilA